MPVANSISARGADYADHITTYWHPSFFLPSTIPELGWNIWVTFFFLNDLFLYLAIDTMFHPFGIFKMAWKFLQNFIFQNGVIT